MNVSEENQGIEGKIRSLQSLQSLFSFNLFVIAVQVVDQYSITMDEPQYKDDDLVYVDPRARAVIGKVEWSNAGLSKPLPMKEEETEEGDDGKRRRRTRYYPWGTYRSMKKVFKIGDWKHSQGDRQIPLDQAIEKAMEEPYWD